MSNEKQILWYHIAWMPQDRNQIQLVAVFSHSVGDYMTIGPEGDILDMSIFSKQIEVLVKKYGLPVPAQTIIEHFNREILSE